MHRDGHARVVRRGDTMLLRDLGSCNGTQIGDHLATVDRDTVLRHGGSFQIGTDVFVFEYPAVGVVLDAVLSSPGGQRSIRLTDGLGREELVAGEGWYLPVVSAFRANGDVAVCWNRWTGPESAPGAMPHPTSGLPLVCRVRIGGKWGAEVQASHDDAPSWLIDLVASEDGWILTYYRNKDGWLVTPPVDGDGVFSRRIDGKAILEPASEAP